MDPSASLAMLQDNCFSVLLITGMFYKALSFWAKVVAESPSASASAPYLTSRKPRADTTIPDTQKALQHVFLLVMFFTKEPGKNQQ